MQKEYEIRFSGRGKRDLDKFRKRYWKSYGDYLAILPALELALEKISMTFSEIQQQT